MSLIFATQLTAVATAILAAFAIVTAWYARRAFREQSREVRAIEQQVKDAQELSRQQAELLTVQSGQLELQRQQLDDQREAQRRSQAAKVTAWLDKVSRMTGEPTGRAGAWGARIRNASDLPIFDVQAFFHHTHETRPGGEWEPVMRGATEEKIRVFPPQTDRFVMIPEQVRTMMDFIDQTLVVSIEFTDAAGNCWERDPRGALIPRS